MGAVLAVMWAAALAVLAASASAAPAPAKTAPSITRSAHVAFENCNAQHIVLSVTVPGHVFTPTESVPYTVRLRNTGSTMCGGPLAQHVNQARQSLTVGSCGALFLAVSSANGVNVYPGPVASSCGTGAGFRLGPHSSATTTGSWNQSDVFGSPAQVRHAPPGTYRLRVDRAVTLPLTLTSG